MQDIPFTESKYRFDPCKNLAQHVSYLQSLREALEMQDISVLIQIDNETDIVNKCQINDLNYRTYVRTQYAHEWILKLRNGKANTCNGLREALIQLPQLIINYNPTEKHIENLLTMSIIGVDLNDKRSIEPAQSAFIRAVLFELFPILSQECVALCQVVSRDLEKNKELFLDIEPLNRKYISRNISKIIYYISRINIPESYYALQYYLQHSLPEVRNSAARAVEEWNSSTKVIDLCNAILLGMNDHQSIEYSQHILTRLKELSDPASLPFLYDYRDAMPNYWLLNDTIISCEQSRR